MKTFQVQYPETLEAVMNLGSQDFQNEAKMALAVKLYELGRLTSGQAAELAGVSRVDFLLTCPRFGAPSVRWDEEELAVEFGDLRQ